MTKGNVFDRRRELLLEENKLLQRLDTVRTELSRLEFKLKAKMKPLETVVSYGECMQTIFDCIKRHHTDVGTGIGSTEISHLTGYNKHTVRTSLRRLQPKFITRSGDRLNYRYVPAE